MVMTRDAVIDDAAAFALQLRQTHELGSRAWLEEVERWASEVPILVRQILRTALWRHTHGQIAGGLPVARDVLDLLEVAEAIWRSPVRPVRRAALPAPSAGARAALYRAPAPARRAG